MMLLDRPGVSNGLTMLPERGVASENAAIAEQTVRGEPRAQLRQLTITIARHRFWQKPAHVVFLEHELNRLLTLEAKWDGEQAHVVSDAAVVEAAHVYLALVDDRTILPQFFPLVDGGIQIEWHVGGSDVELEVEADGSLHVFAAEPTGETLLDGVSGVDLAENWQVRLRSFLRRLSSRVRTANKPS